MILPSQNFVIVNITMEINYTASIRVNDQENVYLMH